MTVTKVHTATRMKQSGTEQFSAIVKNHWALNQNYASDAAWWYCGQCHFECVCSFAVTNLMANQARTTKLGNTSCRRFELKVKVTGSKSVKTSLLLRVYWRESAHQMNAILLENSHTSLKGTFSVQVLTSEGWQEAWKNSHKITRSLQWSKTKLEDPHVSLGWASQWSVIFFPSVLCHFGWATRRASGL